MQATKGVHSAYLILSGLCVYCRAFLYHTQCSLTVFTLPQPHSRPKREIFFSSPTFNSCFIAPQSLHHVRRGVASVQLTLSFTCNQLSNFYHHVTPIIPHVTRGHFTLIFFSFVRYFYLSLFVKRGVCRSISVL